MEENKEKRFVLNQSLDNDTRICRYMSFDVFLQLLYGKLFVPRRQLFMDVRESGRRPIGSQFLLKSIGETNHDIQKIQEELKTYDQYSKNLSQSRFLLTACWTIDNGEDFLMWKSYASQIGVCVKTSIGQLLANINYEKYDLMPICSTMSYLSIYQKAGFLESVFAKDKYYQSENEFRIYFVPRGNVLDEEMKSIDTETVERIILRSSEKEEEQSKDPKYPMNIFLDVDPQLISSIVLSPFIKTSTIDCFRNLLRNQFGEIFPNDKYIKESEIIIK